VSKPEFINFLEAQQLNGLRADHLQRAIAVLTEFGVTGVPKLSTAMRWINKTAWA
jgi:hypothetical protein